MKDNQRHDSPDDGPPSLQFPFLFKAIDQDVVTFCLEAAVRVFQVDLEGISPPKFSSPPIYSLWTSKEYTLSHLPTKVCFVSLILDPIG